MGKFWGGQPFTQADKTKLDYLTKHAQYAASASVTNGSWVKTGNDISLTPGYYLFLLYADLSAEVSTYGFKISLYVNNAVEWERVGRAPGVGGGGADIHRCYRLNTNAVVRVYAYNFQAGKTPTVRTTLDIIRLTDA